MKIKRLKQVHKSLNFYKYNFEFSPPFRVLIDGTFCKAALTYKINIREQLPKYLGCEVRFFTSKCILAECEALGSMLYGPLKVLQQFTVSECRHKNPVSPFRCMRWFIRNVNKNKYFLATQDAELSAKARELPGIPILYIAFNAITLEGPSSCSKLYAKQNSAIVTKTSDELQSLNTLKTKVLGMQPTGEKKKRRRGPKNANPLSCLKKKNKPTKGDDSAQKKARSRKRAHKKTSNVSVLLKDFLDT